MAPATSLQVITMERLRHYFLLLSLILAGLTLFLVVRENRSAWKPFQEEYQGI